MEHEDDGGGYKMRTDKESSSMRLDMLKLGNYRQFESFEITFDPKLTVLAGINGAGKTSIL